MNAKRPLMNVFFVFVCGLTVDSGAAAAMEMERLAAPSIFELAGMDRTAAATHLRDVLAKSMSGTLPRCDVKYAPTRQEIDEFNRVNRNSTFSIRFPKYRNYDPFYLSNSSPAPVQTVDGQMIKDFLLRFKDVLRLNTDLQDLQLASLEESAGDSYSATFAQSFDNTAVWGATIVVKGRPATEPHFVHGKYFPAIAPVNRPLLTAEDVKSALAGIFPSTVLPSPVLYIFPVGCEMRYVYTATVGDQESPFRVVVDAETGVVIENHANYRSAEARALVYQQNPYHSTLQESGFPIDNSRRNTSECPNRLQRYYSTLSSYEGTHHTVSQNCIYSGECDH